MEHSPSRPESSVEKIHTEQEILDAIAPHVEREPTITRVLSDEKGPYLIEATIPGTEAGEFVEFTYTRKGRHAPNIESGESVIAIAYYESGEPVGGTTFARFADGRWEHLD